MKPTLFILAAGMGSRYGGLKQLDGIGPGGETIMDYSVYDALRAGFGKVVFVIGKHFEQDFREKILSKYQGHTEVELVFQSVDALPEGFSVPADRVKPWGTNHAVLMGKEAIKEPFAVINADDFYGRDSFRVLAEWLRERSPKTQTEAAGAMKTESKGSTQGKAGVAMVGAAEGSTNNGTVSVPKAEYCMVGFRLGNTLSESGSVARGVCSVDGAGLLTGVTERTDIRRQDGVITFTDENGRRQTLSDDTPVSMNMWGLTPDYFKHSEEIFVDFLRKNIGNPKAEYYIPLAINELVTADRATVKVLDTNSQWFGVTYAEDRPQVVGKIAALVAAGEYPEKLWV